MLERGEQIVIELPSHDRYTVSWVGGSLQLAYNDIMVCNYNSNLPLSKDLFKTALDKVLCQLKNLLEVE